MTGKVAKTHVKLKRAYEGRRRRTARASWSIGCGRAA